MVHFGANVTNAVNHRKYSKGYSEQTDLKTDQFLCHNFGGGKGAEPIKQLRLCVKPNCRDGIP